MKKTISNAKLAELLISTQNLVNRQLSAGVSTHQLARNPYSMKRMIMATFILHNPKKVQFPNIGLTTNEIIEAIKAMNFRVTFRQVTMELQNLKRLGKIDGGYYKGSGKGYVWSVVE